MQGPPLRHVKLQTEIYSLVSAYSKLPGDELFDVMVIRAERSSTEIVSLNVPFDIRILLKKVLSSESYMMQISENHRNRVICRYHKKHKSCIKSQISIKMS